MEVLVIDAAEMQELLEKEDWTFADCPLTVERLTPEMLVVVVLDLEAKRLLACWPIWNAAHVDGLWVDAEFHGNPRVLRPLVESVSATLAANQVHTTYALLAEDDAAGQDMASRLGFARVPGVLYRRETPS